MGLVKDHRIGAGQQLRRRAVSAQGGIGKEQMMINHHQIRFLGLLAGLHQGAFLVVGAVGAQAVVCGTGDPGPYRRVFGNLLQLGDVAGLGAPGPVSHDLQLLGGFPGQKTGLFLMQGQSIGAEIIGSPFQQRHLTRQPKGFLDQWHILEEELILQALCAGRHQRRALRQQGRHQIGQRLAGAGFRLDHQGTAGADHRIHSIRHGQLRLTGLIARQKRRKARQIGKMVTGAGHTMS